MIIYFWRTRKLLPTSPVPLAHPPAREGREEKFEPSWLRIHCSDQPEHTLMGSHQLEILGSAPQLV